LLIYKYWQKKSLGTHFSKNHTERVSNQYSPEVVIHSSIFIALIYTDITGMDTSQFMNQIQ